MERMDTTGLNARVLKAQEDGTEFEALVRDYRPYILSELRRNTGARFTDTSHDWYDTALLGFYEAVQKFNPARGNFLSFSRTIIRVRLADDFRRESRQNETTSWEDDSSERKSLLDTLAMDRYRAQEHDSAARLEIEQFVQELSEWNITLQDVYRDCPRHRKRRENVKQMVRLLLADEPIIQAIVTTLKLPLNEICARFGGSSSRKELEKSRRYIIACLVISLGEYDVLRGYIQ